MERADQIGSSRHTVQAKMLLPPFWRATSTVPKRYAYDFTNKPAKEMKRRQIKKPSNYGQTANGP